MNLLAAATFFLLAVRLPVALANSGAGSGSGSGAPAPKTVTVTNMYYNSSDCQNQWYSKNLCETCASDKPCDKYEKSDEIKPGTCTCTDTICGYTWTAEYTNNATIAKQTALCHERTSCWLHDVVWNTWGRQETYHMHNVNCAGFDRTLLPTSAPSAFPTPAPELMPWYWTGPSGPAPAADADDGYDYGVSHAYDIDGLTEDELELTISPMAALVGLPEEKIQIEYNEIIIQTGGASFWLDGRRRLQTKKWQISWFLIYPSEDEADAKEDEFFYDYGFGTRLDGKLNADPMIMALGTTVKLDYRYVWSTRRRRESSSDSIDDEADLSGWSWSSSSSDQGSNTPFGLIIGILVALVILIALGLCAVVSFRVYNKGGAQKATPDAPATEMAASAEA